MIRIFGYSSLRAEKEITKTAWSGWDDIDNQNSPEKTLDISTEKRKKKRCKTLHTLWSLGPYFRLKPIRVVAPKIISV